MPPALLTRGLSRVLDRGFAVRDVDLVLPTGAVYGLLGPNGAGKTTLLQLMLGLLRPDTGEVEVFGVDARRRGAEARRRIGYVPERLSLYGWMTGARAIRHHRIFYPGWDPAYAAELHRRMEIPLDRRVSQLSKGQAGKLSLLLALAHRPPLLLLDEPTDGLDAIARRDFMQLVLEYVADAGASVLVSSHLVHELERFADTVGVMDHGTLAAQMPMDAFRHSVKRLRLRAEHPISGEMLPFRLLGREVRGREEVWTVEGWERGMEGALTGRGVEVRGVVDLDLEECYVELLRSRTAPEKEDV